MELVLNFYNEIFTIEMLEEYAARTSLGQQACQEMATVTLHDLPNAETDAVECHLAQNQGPTTSQVL